MQQNKLQLLQIKWFTFIPRMYKIHLETCYLLLFGGTETICEIKIVRLYAGCLQNKAQIRLFKVNDSTLAENEHSI